MRAVLVVLLVALIGVTAWSFWAAPDHGWWLPPCVSTFGHEVDRLFHVILVIVAIAFLLTEGLLVWCVVRYARPIAGAAARVHGITKLEIAWTSITAAILGWLAFAQIATWNTIKAESMAPTTAPLAEVWAQQFDWRFTYPGRDGKFGTVDDLLTVHELVVPVNERVVLSLRSHDVLHSFFVPAFRLKQDAVPGMAVPIWFQAEKEGTYDLICAELCGWGHYKMAGRVRVVARERYDAWIAARERHLASNGAEDRR